MNRRVLALRLVALLLGAGVLPILAVGVFSIATLRARNERAAQDALRQVAEQAAGRIDTYLQQQRTLLRALAANLSTDPEARHRLEEVTLDAPALGRIKLIDASTPEADLPRKLSAAEIVRALHGEEVLSPVYVAQDLTPAMDACVPARGRAQAVCATMDLLELQRLVQHIVVGEHGFALALDGQGRVLAAGAGVLRAAALAGEAVTESVPARAVAHGQAGPERFVNGAGTDVLAGWAALPDQSWIVVVERPSADALRTANTAQLILVAAALFALLLSVAVGVVSTQRMLAALEVEERWRTAGRIASGITHDLGHRLAVLQQTAGLAELGDASFLPLIRDNLRNEVDTLRRFVSEFADLSRGVHGSELMPLELAAFAESVRRTAEPLARKAQVSLAVKTHSGAPPWALADRHLLERAVLNLVTNAVEASGAGATVELRVRRDEESRRALLEVRDFGPGIAPERLPGLFDAFASTKRTGAHLGMGLPNVRRIARTHGGDVAVRSTPGEGSLFSLWLPLYEPSSSSAGPIA